MEEKCKECYWWSHVGYCNLSSNNANDCLDTNFSKFRELDKGRKNMDNELTRRLYKMSIGSKLNMVSKDANAEGTFIRVPTGWIYRYINRSSLTSCFIPYSDNINYYDMDMPIKPCFSCDSKNVRLVHNDSLQNMWHGECLDCGARAGNVEGKQFALTLWNNTIRKK